MLNNHTEIFHNVLSRIAATDAEVKPSESDVVEEDGVFRLLKYRPAGGRRYETPMLIVCAFINRPYVLDLQPEISVVQKYLRAGFEVYMIDWGYPGRADRFLMLDDYAGFLEKCLRRVTRESGAAKVNLHGYCLGGTICAAYTALDQRRVKNLVLQTTPVDFQTDNLIACWARSIDPDKITEAFGEASGSFMNLAFLLVDPVNLTFGKYAGLLEAKGASDELANFLKMENWVFDSPSIPAGTFRQYIKQWYHENLLIKGQFRLLDKRVDLKNITVPLLVLAAKYDHIVPPEAQIAAIRAVSSEDTAVYEVAKGHVGITTSRSSHTEYWPRTVKWLEARSQPVSAPPVSDGMRSA